MTKDQVTLIKESYLKEAKRPDGTRSTAAEYMRFCLDGNIDFATSKDLVIFDDENNMLHCICVNDDARSQAMYPIKIMSSDYGIIQQLEGIMSRQNFEDFVNTGFISKIISKEKAEYLINFARGINNQAIQPKEAEPFFPVNPQIIPMHNTQIMRDKNIKDTNLVSVKIARSSKDVKKLIENAEVGDVIMIDAAAPISEALTIDKSIVLISNGAEISAPITITGNDTEVSIQGFKLTNENGSGNILTATCKSIFIENCEFYAMTSANTLATITCTDSATIRGSVFDSDKDSNGTILVKNGIEFSQKIPISKIEITNNTFSKTCCRNNDISLFAFADNAEVNISNNLFEFSGNALRVSNNIKNKNVKISCVGNTYLQTTDDDYCGFMFFQYPNSSANDDFSSISMLIKGLTGPDNKSMKESNASKILYYVGIPEEKRPNVVIS